MIFAVLTVSQSATVKHRSTEDEIPFDLQSTLPSIVDTTTGSGSFAPFPLKGKKEVKGMNKEQKGDQLSSPAFLSKEMEHSRMSLTHGMKVEQTLVQSGHPGTPFPQHPEFNNFNDQMNFPDTQDQHYSSLQNQEHIFRKEQSKQQDEQFFVNNPNGAEPRQYAGAYENSQWMAPEQEGLPQGFRSDNNPMNAPSDNYFSRMNTQTNWNADKQMMSLQTQGRSSPFGRLSQLHSSSLVVSGLNNLPMLPALVYSSGPVPSSHAIATSKGTLLPLGSSVRQHLQTPYVRYVYSHML